ncbi:winged helix-turn-helix transcriptional regulator [Halorarum salinum]|uniref:Winged helix-turn-helix transcriptional regulator n=1 Tax=Halorarum salinum TaxID=2743089 RepID=A0A7D5QL40_9EURY|nr:winged helix-turn-helix transcriptional regulator [Halobaculum salinum]QLG62565.1 winged helix-turn-helix transcriptional regulator [Halobaculum salinum]
MRDLDDTDLDILRMLTEDGRRSYSDIAEAVDLSPPAVSDRVSRLRETGVIRRFTVDVDRSTLRAGAPTLVRVTPAAGDRETVRESLVDAGAVEHVFVTDDGDVLAHVRVPDRPTYEWVEATLGPQHVADFAAEPLVDAEWTPSVGAAEFAFECAECGNSVTNEGSTARVGGTLHHFCCPTCESQFRERYERIEEEA